MQLFIALCYWRKFWIYTWNWLIPNEVLKNRSLCQGQDEPNWGYWFTQIQKVHYLYTAEWLTNTLLPRTFYSSTRFAPWNTSPLNTVCCLEHSALGNTLLPRTLCFSAYFASWNTLLLKSPGTFYFFANFPPPHTLLPGILKAKCSREQSVPGRKVFLRAKCTEEQSEVKVQVFLKRNVCGGIMCVRQ